MNKKLFYIIFISFSLLVVPKDVFATSYDNRHVCKNFELAGAHTDGTIAHVSCYDSYDSAKSAMNKNGASDLIIIDERTTPKIVDAMYALVDLTVNGLTYFYESPTLNTRQYTAINTSPSYGGSDAAFISVNPSNFAAKVKIANFTGWISKDSYEIVPLNFVILNSHYTVSGEGIKHNYVKDIKSNSPLGGRTIGPKPDMLENGTYFSYDGHYFYTSVFNMLKDYKNGNYNNSVNKNNPYYNYYMYLSNHSKTTYSSVNIDEYTKALGYSMNVYGNKAKSGSSRLYGMGTFFYNTQQKYGVNAVLSYSLSRNETGNGTSNLAVNKNNGFGLNAVDSNPYNDANYYASFASSIYGYASKWNSYGYSYATDWRYFGPAFGDKYNGMNVKYATDAYWSEKMASNYYNLDKYFGLNDYNYYQLGVVNKPTKAYFEANTNSKAIYTYPEEEDQVLIVGSVGNFYKVMSDMNIDSNGNLVGSKTDYTKAYNWNTNYVYVSKSDIKLINKGKNGYISPESVTNYQDHNYSYDLYIENTILKPKVAKVLQDTSYFSDSALTSKTGKKVLKDKVVMVYTAAYDESNQVVAYLITSDYLYDQKSWVQSSAISFISSDYGMQTVNLEGQYEWVCSSPIDNEKYKIGGQYTNSYFPIVGEEGNWYKVPVSLDTNNNSIGYILKSEKNAYITKYNYKVSNQAPVITASNQKIKQNQVINLKDYVKAVDEEDKDITNKVVISGEVNTKIPGKYEIVYTVTDSGNLTVSKKVIFEVIEDKVPVIEASDNVLRLNAKFNEKQGVKAFDTEDGDITDKIKVIENNVDTTKVGEYKVIYQVTDSFNHTVKKEIKVSVVDKSLEEKQGLYYFNYLKVVNKKLEIKGYHAIKGINNDKDTSLTYKIVFVNLDTKEEYTNSLERIMDKNEFERPVYSTDNFDYTYSWFKGNIDINNLPDGDYQAYIVTESDTYFAKTIISNKVLKEQVATYKDKKYLTTRNNYRNSKVPLEFIIRKEKIGEKSATSTYNQYNQYRIFNFENNKLRIMGTSYSLGMNLAKDVKVERKIVFENTKTYKKYTYDASSITNGLYKVGTTLNDNLDKTRAWFDTSMDLSDFEKGVYAIYITTSSNISDYGELTELLFRSLDDVKLTTNNKNYSFRINKDLRYRIELIVE